MGYINPIAKWDLKRNKWDYDIRYEDVGRAYSFINFNDEKEDVNYIIFSPGVRVENATKKDKSFKINYLNMDNILKHFKNKEEKYNIKLQLMDADAPIIEEAKLLANFIDSISSSDNTKSITLVGYSKCGVMNTYVPSFFKNEDSFIKTNIINAAAPYKGTIMASNSLIFKKFYSGVMDKIKNTHIANILSNKFKKFYEKTSSNSHMDYDISIPNGISEDKKSLYDEDFIKNVFREENINSLKKINSFTNISTGIDEDTLKEAIKNFDIENIELFLMGKYILKDQNDGIVPVDSQLEIEKYMDIKSRNIKSCSHNINSNRRCLNELLSIVDETISNKKYIKR